MVEIANGELVPFEIELHTTERHVNVTFGRFSRDYTTESLGVSPDGNSIVISAMYDRRSLMLADHISLQHWK